MSNEKTGTTTIYNSINYLAPYLQQQPIMRDLSFFYDYLGVFIENDYNDLRYRYIDWTKISEASAIEIFRSMGMDYIVDLIEVIQPINHIQFLALCSLIWLLKGDLKGVNIIAAICDFTYTYTVWHEQKPLGVPNTAVMELKFKPGVQLSENFQYNLIGFLSKYLYPVITTKVYPSDIEGKIYSGGAILCKQNIEFTEVIPESPVEYGYSKYGNVVENGNLITWSGNQAAFIISNTEEVLTDVIGSNPWELVTKVSITNSGGQMYFGLTNYKSTNATSNSTDAEFQTNANTTHEFAYIKVYTAQSNNYYGTHTLGTTFNGHLKLEYTGTQYMLSCSTNNKETWTTLSTYAFSSVCTQKKYAFFRIYGSAGAGVDNFNLKETYLSVNGQKVWQAMQ